MMTADEKNHVISNANEELDRQVVRLDTVFPYIAGEISEEARLGSLTHWAYSNKNAVKTAANERPRREAVSHRQDLSHALHEAEPSSRSELRREALARKPRRANADADYEDSRGPRKTTATKSRGDNAGVEQNATAKRRRVEKERPPAIDMGTPMERTASGATSQRASAKDGVEKKRSRAPNSGTSGARKKYAFPIDSPVPSVSFANCSTAGQMSLPMPDRLSWLPHLLSEPSMPHVELEAPDRTQHALNPLELSRLRDKPAMPDKDRHHLRLIALARLPVR